MNKFTVTNELGHTLIVELSGDIGGNAQENIFRFHGDQFELEGNDGLRIDFFGTWELESFFELVKKVEEAMNYTKISKETL